MTFQLSEGKLCTISQIFRHMISASSDNGTDIDIAPYSVRSILSIVHRLKIISCIQHDHRHHISLHDDHLDQVLDAQRLGWQSCRRAESSALRRHSGFLSFLSILLRSFLLFYINLVLLRFLSFYINLVLPRFVIFLFCSFFYIFSFAQFFIIWYQVSFAWVFISI